jgi:hypothetical protein
MTDFTAATLLKRIEQHADDGHIPVLDLWHAVSADGWDTGPFVEGLNQLALLDYVGIIGDRVVLKEPQAPSHPSGSSDRAGHNEAPPGYPTGLGARSRLGQAASGRPW